MVKIAQAYNFPQQASFELGGEIASAALVGDHHVLVGSKENFVEFIDIRDGNCEAQPVRRQLPTMGEVLVLIYCEKGKFLVTLEKEARSRRVRVYTNLLKFVDSDLQDIPFAPRIVAKVSPQSLLNDHVDVIEFPIDAAPELIACCQSSGNILVTSKDQLLLFEYHLCTNDSHRFSYVDFAPAAYTMQLSFSPTHLQLAENMVACMSRSLAVVFRVDYTHAAIAHDYDCDSVEDRVSKTSAPLSSNSFDTDSLENTVNSMQSITTVDFAVAQTANSVCGREFATELKSQWDQMVKIVPKEDTSPMHADVKIKLVPVGNELMRLPHVQVVHASTGNFFCMDLKPIYQQQAHNKTGFLDLHAAFKSEAYGGCVGFSFLLAAAFEGFLYQFCNQDKWYNDNSKPVATYPFLTCPHWVKIDDLVIHFITTNSVETYTSRVGHKIFSNRFEYPTVNVYPEESSPEASAPLSIIGRRSFADIAVVCSNAQRLVLVTAGRLAAVTFPSLQLLIHDIESMASSYREVAPQRFYELTEEAHVMLRLALTVDLQLPADARDAVRLRFEQNCRCLADFCVRSPRKDVHMKAIGFYKMCGVEPDEVYAHYVSSHLSGQACFVKDDLSGFVYTIKQFVHELGMDKSKASFLGQTVAPLFAQEATGEVTLAVELLSLFARCDEEALPAVLLNSPLLVDAARSELIAYLTNKTPKCPSERLLLAMTTSPAASLQVVAGMTRCELWRCLVAHQNVLFEDNFQQELAGGAAFSEFTELTLFALEDDQLIEAVCDTFITIVCIERTMELAAVLPLFMNFFATHIGLQGCRTSQRVLTSVLQAHFYKHYSNRHSSETKSRHTDDCSEETLETDDAMPRSAALISGEYHLLSGRISCDYEKAEPKLDAFGDQPPTSLSALKVLFRMHLGQLKLLSEHQPPDDQHLLQLRYECIGFLASHIDLVKNLHAKASHVVRMDSAQLRLVPNYAADEQAQLVFHRPIPCLDSRPMFLNKMPPFADRHFAKADNECELDFVGWDDEVVVLVLKIQSLLASPLTHPSIVDEFVKFIQKSPFLIGIDSLIMTILPKPIAMEFLINAYPELLWTYGKSSRFTTKHWEFLLRKLLSKQDVVPNWKVYLNDILSNLVHERSFEDLLQCFPADVVTDNTSLIIRSLDIQRPVVMDNVDESNAFEIVLREAVAKQRSIALRSMIESTGSQFFDSANA